MKQELDLCMGCMSVKSYSGPCEICGYIENTAYLPRFLAPHTVLSDRYIVGRMLSYNGEGALYIAYDTETDKVVEIREYLPDSLCTRKKNTENVVVNDGCLPLYKSYLSEFADLHKMIMNNNESESIQKVYGIFAANNTGYVVLEHMNGRSLAEVLDGGDGRLVWQSGSPAVRDLFPPLLTALNMLHSHGIIHRGLSPESIWVDERGRLKLTSFCTSASRTEGSSINCELFGGYAAPEQYEVSERQGTWTDIYGICAVLYRVLTGNQPQEANSRELNDVLEQPYFINPAVPHNVSDTVMAGMCMRQDERIHTVNELVEKLFTQQEPPAYDEDDGPIIPAVARVNLPSHSQQQVRKTPPRRKPAAAKKGKKKEKSNVGTIVGLSVFLAIVVCFVIAIVYFSQASVELMQQAFTSETEKTTSAALEAPSTTTTARPQTTTTAEAAPASSGGGAERMLLPDFVNRFYEKEVNRYPKLNFNPTYEYNNDYTEGIIFYQDIEPNTEVTGGVEINVKVSKGPELAELPDYTGKKVEKYTKELSELGIKYDVEEEETSEVKEGYVSRCSREPGDKIKISADEKVIVYSAKKPKKTKPKETEAPQDEPEQTEQTEQTQPAGQTASESEAAWLTPGF